jgi:CRP-like cAMP-binding protein
MFRYRGRVTGAVGWALLIAFGEMARLSDAPRNATIRAASKLRVATLGKSNFKALLTFLLSTKGDILKTVQARAMAEASLLHSDL